LGLDRDALAEQRLSEPETWQAIESELGRSILRVYELTPERVRLDATTVSGYHASGEETLFQYGHSKDDPSLAQVKVMVAALDPLELPLVTKVVAGNQADDPLYVPAVDRVLQIIEGAVTIVSVILRTRRRMSTSDGKSLIFLQCAW
jgi:transposase